MVFETVEIVVAEKIAHLTLNQPKSFNAMQPTFWRELVEAFEVINNSDARVTVIDAAGKHFTSGLDIQAFLELGLNEKKDVGRRAENLRQQILLMQRSFNTIEKARMPVIVAVHGACIGGGVDMISACDIRYATEDAFFSIHEINIGMAADVGTLHRLPYLMPDGLVRELAYTGRRLGGSEAAACGLVNNTFPDRDSLIAHVMDVAQEIAEHSPIALSGTKEMLTYSRDHNVSDSLNYVATWNSAMLQSADFAEGIEAQVEKRSAEFADLESLPSFKKESHNPTDQH